MEEGCVSWLEGGGDKKDGRGKVCASHDLLSQHYWEGKDAGI